MKNIFNFIIENVVVFLSSLFTLAAAILILAGVTLFLMLFTVLVLPFTLVLGKRVFKFGIKVNNNE